MGALRAPALPVNRFKWADWLANLGVRAAPTFVVDLQEGRRWWEQHGEVGLPDTQPFLDAFPHGLVREAYPGATDTA